MNRVNKHIAKSYEIVMKKSFSLGLFSLSRKDTSVNSAGLLSSNSNFCSVLSNIFQHWNETMKIFTRGNALMHIKLHAHVRNQGEKWKIFVGRCKVRILTLQSFPITLG